MAQHVSSKNLLLAHQPLVVGVISHPDAIHSFLKLSEVSQRAACDLIELRLDELEMNPLTLQESLMGLTTPLLVTARHPAEGGRNGLDAEARIALLEPFLHHAVLCDVEVRSLQEMNAWITRARQVGMGIIGSFHDFERTPSDEVLEGAAAVAEAAGLDAIKVATFVHSPDDLIRLMRWTARERRVRVSAMGMGPFGRVSRLVLAKCGSVLNYGYLGVEANANGQWPSAELRTCLNKL